jgi:hypothetical protein
MFSLLVSLGVPGLAGACEIGDGVHHATGLLKLTNQMSVICGQDRGHYLFNDRPFHVERRWLVRVDHRHSKQ